MFSLLVKELFPDSSSDKNVALGCSVSIVAERLQHSAFAFYTRQEVSEEWFCLANAFLFSKVGHNEAETISPAGMSLWGWLLAMGLSFPPGGEAVVVVVVACRFCRHLATSLSTSSNWKFREWFSVKWLFSFLLVYTQRTYGTG